MQEGAKDCIRWLTDQYEKGLIQLQGEGDQQLADIAQRMVDTKNGAIARRFRMLVDVVGSHADWPAQTNRQRSQAERTL